MKALLILCCAAISPTVFAAPTEPRVTLADLAWLAGTWELKSEKRTVTEMWMQPSGRTMLGVSRTVSGGATVEHEFMILRESEDGTIVFEATPSGQPGASFTRVPGVASELVFENLAHDFPQRVIYRLNPDGTLLAAIEGVRQGKLRRIEFPYTRLGSAGGPLPR